MALDPAVQVEQALGRAHDAGATHPGVHGQQPRLGPFDHDGEDGVLQERLDLGPGAGEHRSRTGNPKAIAELVQRAFAGQCPRQAGRGPREQEAARQLRGVLGDEDGGGVVGGHKDPWAPEPLHERCQAFEQQLRVTTGSQTNPPVRYWEVAGGASRPSCTA